MFNKSAYFTIAVLLFLSLVFSACGGSVKTPSQSAAPTNPNPSARHGTITTGQKVEAVTQSIDTTGATLAVSKPGDPLDGFVIDIPAQAYTANVPFKVSYAPITNQTFGPDITPISPLITIDNGGVVAGKIIYLRIPAKVPEGYFAMGFIYDAKTGQLEGLPLINSDSESVTIGTTHFCDLFLGMIDKALLENEIDSGFKPGVDDWQFTNFGSYIAPGGHCAGQAISAMWYYCTRPDGSDAHLFGRYDNNGEKPATPDIWQDDSLGYRFASVIQTISWDDKALNFWRNLQGKHEKFDSTTNTWKLVDVPLGLSDEMTRNLFAYSMRATGEPQYVNIRSNAGGGHVMVVYKIKDGQLYVADPNYPGNTERRIQMSSGSFIPYNSGADAGEIAKGNGRAYEKIMYYAKSTVISWDAIGAEWAKVKNQTIGNDQFPAYQLYGNNDPLTDNTITPWEAIKIQVGSNSGMECVIYRDGVRLQPDPNGNYTLEAGDNKLGIAIWGKVNGDWEFIDFKDVNVIYKADLAIAPRQLNGEVGKEYTFSVVHNAPHPKDVTYDWYINKELKQSSSATDFKTTFAKGGSYTVDLSVVEAGLVLGKADAATANIKDVPELTVTPAELKGETGKQYTFTAALQNSPPGAITYEWSVNGIVKNSSAETSFKNTFAAEGTYTVNLRALLAGQEIAKFDSKVTITKPTPSPSAPVNNLAIIQQYGYLEASLFTSSMVHEYDKYDNPTDVDIQANVTFWTLYTPITWDGVKFSGAKTDTSNGSTTTQTLSGTVSPDGNTLLTLTSQLQSDSAYEHKTVSMVLQNIPLTYKNGTLWGGGVTVTSANVQNHVVSLGRSFNNLDKGVAYFSNTFTSPIWDDNSSLTLSFRKTATR